MANKILIKPIITEKSENLVNRRNQYVFLVAKEANKIEIAKEVFRMYNVPVESVNTMVMPGKFKSRNTKSGMLKGRVPAFKKAVITLAEGESINFFGEI